MKVKICDVCREEIKEKQESLYGLPLTRYSITKYSFIGKENFDLCNECMKKFIHYIRIPCQENIPPMPPSGGNVAQKD